MNKKNGVLILGFIFIIIAGLLNFFKGAFIFHEAVLYATYIGSILIIVGFFIFNRTSKK